MQDVTINNLGGGVVPALFVENQQRVLENIADASVPAKGKRSIIFQIDYEPSEERSVAQITVSVKCKLAGSRGAQVPVYLGYDGDTFVVKQADIAQQEFGFQGQEQRQEGEATI